MNFEREWERQPFCVSIVLLVHAHKVPHGCAVGYLGGRSVPRVPLYNWGAALGPNTVRGGRCIAATAVCRWQAEKDRETRSGDALTIPGVRWGEKGALLALVEKVLTLWTVYRRTESDVRSHVLVTGLAEGSGDRGGARWTYD